jgi:hypothetical protein
MHVAVQRNSVRFFASIFNCLLFAALLRPPHWEIPLGELALFPCRSVVLAPLFTVPGLASTHSRVFLHSRNGTLMDPRSWPSSSAPGPRSSFPYHGFWCVIPIPSTSYTHTKARYLVYPFAIPGSGAIEKNQITSEMRQTRGLSVSPINVQ